MHFSPHGRSPLPTNRKSASLCACNASVESPSAADGPRRKSATRLRRKNCGGNRMISSARARASHSLAGKNSASVCSTPPSDVGTCSVCGMPPCASSGRKYRYICVEKRFGIWAGVSQRVNGCRPSERGWLFLLLFSATPPPPLREQDPALLETLPDGADAVCRAVLVQPDIPPQRRQRPVRGVDVAPREDVGGGEGGGSLHAAQQEDLVRWGDQQDAFFLTTVSDFFLGVFR
ncbi:MAG: hypothetical protein Q9193_004466 [Seirophora villosa]